MASLYCPQCGNGFATVAEADERGQAPSYGFTRGDLCPVCPDARPRLRLTKEALAKLEGKHE